MRAAPGVPYESYCLHAVHDEPGPEERAPGARRPGRVRCRGCGEVSWINQLCPCRSKCVRCAPEVYPVFTEDDYEAMGPLW